MLVSPIGSSSDYPAQRMSVTVILDRLLHHSATNNIRGDSYRLKDRRRAGLLQKAGTVSD